MNSLSLRVYALPRLLNSQRSSRSPRLTPTLGLLILAATSLDAGIIRVRTTATSAYPGHSVSDDSGLLEAASTAAFAASSGIFPSGVGTAFGDALASSDYDFNTGGIDWVLQIKEMNNLRISAAALTLGDRAFLGGGTAAPPTAIPTCSCAGSGVPRTSRGG